MHIWSSYYHVNLVLGAHLLYRATSIYIRIKNFSICSHCALTFGFRSDSFFVCLIYQIKNFCYFFYFLRGKHWRRGKSSCYQDYIYFLIDLLKKYHNNQCIPIIGVRVVYIVVTMLYAKYNKYNCSNVYVLKKEQLS